MILRQLKIFLFLLIITFITSCSSVSSVCPISDIPTIESNPNSLTGVWVVKRFPFIGETNLGCRVDESATLRINGQDIKHGYQLIIQQIDNSLSLPPLEIESDKGKFCNFGNGSVQRSQVKFAYSGGGFEIQAIGKVSLNWKEVKGEMVCRYLNESTTAKQDFIMTKLTSSIPQREKTTIEKIVDISSQIKKTTNDTMQPIGNSFVTIMLMFTSGIALLEQGFRWACQFGNGLSIAGFGLGILVSVFAFLGYARDRAGGLLDFFSDWNNKLDQSLKYYNTYHEGYFSYSSFWETIRCSCNGYYSGWSIIGFGLGLAIIIDKTHADELSRIGVFLLNCLTLSFAWILGVIFIFLVSNLFTSKLIITNIVDLFQNSFYVIIRGFLLKVMLKDN